MWPERLPGDFTADLMILLHWNDTGARLRPVLADDWTNPQRPKPDLLSQEFSLLVQHAVRRKRVAEDRIPALDAWFATVHELMAQYQHERDDPRDFENELLQGSLQELDKRLNSSSAPQTRPGDGT